MRLSIGVGLIGCGTVGAALAERLLRGRTEIEARSGLRYELRGIAVRSSQLMRPAGLPSELFLYDARALAADPAIDVLVECAGGTSDIADAVEIALERGAHVVTANKELIATQGPRLRALAAMAGGTLSYEAAVCGAVPIVRVLAHALAGDQILSIDGIVNGTTNAILSAMEGGSSYAAALADAQRRGYAEADPANDVEGFDAAHKLALLAQLSFGCGVVTHQIARGGITHVTARDIKRARASGHRIRLIAAARKTAGGVAAEVAPVFVPGDHPFARAHGPENVVRVVARDAGPLLLAGTGAGGTATASAVLGDILAAFRAIAERRSGVRRAAHAAPVAVEPFFSRSPGSQYAVYPGDDALLRLGDCGAIGA